MNEILKNQFYKLKEEISSLIGEVDTSKNSHLQNYIYFVFFPLFSYAESIIVLSENAKYHSAKVILRTLFETHINVIYYQTGNSERKLALATKSGFDGKIRNIRELRHLINKYPNLLSKDPTNLFSNEWLDSAEEWAQKQQTKIVNINNLKDTDRDPDLKSKTVDCDAAVIKTAEPGHFGRMYSVVYRQLSAPSHLNIDGLQTFVTQDSDGNYLFDDGDDGDFLMSEAIAVCVAFTKDLYDLGILKGSPPAILKIIEDQIK